MSENNGSARLPAVGTRVKLLTTDGLSERFKGFRGYQGEVVGHLVDSGRVLVRFYGLRNKHCACRPAQLEVMAPFNLTGTAEAG